LISLMGTAAVAAFALRLPFSAAMLLGALLAITDTVSVLLAFRSVKVPHRLAAIMEGESLFNDGTALVLVSLTTTILSQGSFDFSLTLRALVVAMVGGAALGVVIGMAGAALLRRTPDHLTAILASLVLVLGTAALAEEVQVSPVIAVVVAGLFVGTAARRALEPSRVLALFGFWETTGFAINVLLFLGIGMQLDPSMLLGEAPSILLALVALHAGRAIAVYGCCFALKVIAREKISPRWQHVMVLGNIKGALSMAAVLALPTTLPYRDRLIAIVFGTTLVTLVSQALPLKRWLTLLGVAESPSDERFAAARAQLIAARCGHTQLDELLAAGLLDRKEHAERRAAFQRQIIGAEHVLRGAANQDHVVDSTLLYAQKAALLDAARRGLIPPNIAEAEVEQLDRGLVSLELAPHEKSGHGDPKKGQ
jgi:CPA1 family monovalent cation:H+ antiporter